MADISIFVLAALGCVFGVSAVAKLRNAVAFRSFRAGLGDTMLIPPALVTHVAVILCAAEGVSALGLVAGAGLTAYGAPGAVRAAAAALAAAVALCASLTIGVAWVIHRGARVACFCFGTAGGKPIGRVHLLRNTCLLAMACLGLVGLPFASHAPARVGALLAILAGLVTAVIVVRWDELAELFRPLSRPDPLRR